MGLNVNPKNAESLKIEYGFAQSKEVDELEIVEEIDKVGWTNPKPILRKYIAEIIESRMQEIFDLVRKELIQNDMLEFLPGGIVITGGASQLEGLCKMVSEIFRLPTRVGYPQRLEGFMGVENPIFATSAGLLIYGKNSRLGEVKNLGEGGNLFSELIEHVKDWFKNLF